MHRKRDKREQRAASRRASVDQSSLLGHGRNEHCPACGHLISAMPEGMPAQETRPASAQGAPAAEQPTNVLVDAERLLDLEQTAAAASIPPEKQTFVIGSIAAVRALAEKTDGPSVPVHDGTLTELSAAASVNDALVNDAPPSDGYVRRVLVNVRMAAALLERIQQSGIDLAAHDYKAPAAGPYAESLASSIYSVRTSLSLLETASSALLALTAAADEKTQARAPPVSMPPPRPLWQPAPPDALPKDPVCSSAADGLAQATEAEALAEREAMAGSGLLQKGLTGGIDTSRNMRKLSKSASTSDLKPTLAKTLSARRPSLQVVLSYSAAGLAGIRSVACSCRKSCRSWTRISWR